MSRRYSILFIAVLMSACAERDTTSGLAGGESASPASSPTPTLVEAEIPFGWDEIVMISGYAEVKISTAGHFSTSRNECLVSESGAIELKDWNAIVRSLKVALSAPVLSEANLACKPTAMVSRGLDGTIDIKLPSGRRNLFTVMGMETCTTIGDAAAAQEMLDAINHVLFAAAVEGCSSATP